MRSRPTARTLADAMKAPTSSSAFRSRARSRRTWSSRWRTSRSSSPWPIPTRKSRPRKWPRCATTPSWRPAAPTIPNQINNVLGFPYIFRGALDVRATTINMEMKIAAAQRARRARARGRAGRGRRRLRGAAEVRARLHHPGAVRSAADLVRAAGGGQGGHGYRRRAQADRRHGRLSGSSCAARRDPVAGIAAAQSIERLRRQPKRVVFAEGEEEQVIRAAASFVHQGLGTALLVGREDRVRETAARAGIELGDGIEIINARAVDSATPSTRTTSTSGCSAKVICCATASAWSTTTAIISPPAWWRSAMPTPWSPASRATSRWRSRTCGGCIDPKPGHRVIGVSMVLARGRTVLVADTAVTEMPTSEELADIAIEAAGVARRMGYEPRSACSPSPPSAIRRASARRGCMRRCSCSTSAASISNMTATWRPTSRSIRN